MVSAGNSECANNWQEGKVTAVQMSEGTEAASWQARQEAVDKEQQGLVQEARH